MIALRMRPRHRIPLAVDEPLRGPLRRTRAIRVGLAAAIAGCAVAALFLALRLGSADQRLLPPGEGGLVVMDVSSSITAESYRDVLGTIDEMSTSGRRMGLILFSDTAYEALPPGSRASELAAYRRFFRPVQEGEAPDPTGRLAVGDTEFPANPWVESFTGGTQISAGLLLARAVIERDGIEDPSIVLVSDLSTDQFDVAGLANAVRGFVQDGIPVEVVALAPALSDRLFFSELLRGHGQVVDAPETAVDELEAPARRDDPAFPAALVAAGALLLLLLAANELACGRLVWLWRRA